jgi:hypothetical protein
LPSLSPLISRLNIESSDDEDEEVVRIARGACHACEVAPPAVAPPAVAVAAEAVALPHVPPEAAAGANALPHAAMAQNLQAVNLQSGRAAGRGHGGRGGRVGRG